MQIWKHAKGRIAPEKIKPEDITPITFAEYLRAMVILNVRAAESDLCPNCVNQIESDAVDAARNIVMARGLLGQGLPETPGDKEPMQ